MGKIVFGLIASVAVLGFTVSNASALLIDHFDYGTDFSISVDGTTTAASHLDSGFTNAQILGGSRLTDLTFVSYVGGVGSPPQNADALLSTSGGVMVFNNDTGVRSVMTLTYDGPLFAVPQDLTDGGASDIFIFDFVASDLGADVTVTFTDSSAFVASKTAPSPSGMSTLSYQFNDLAFVGLDFTKITKIVVEIDAKTSGDYEIHDIMTTTNIPEPMTMGAIATALIGLGGYLRRRFA
jgi:hypothetical protein